MHTYIIYTRMASNMRSDF